MIQNISSLDQFKSLLNSESAILVYFSHEKCNVCKVLKPKVEQLLQDSFPKIKMCYSDTEIFPEVAAQNSVFTVPTLIVYLDGKEFIRKSRNIGIMELEMELERPYNLMFS